MPKTTRKNIHGKSNVTRKNKISTNQSKMRGGNCDEFDKKDTRNKKYNLPNKYEFPSNFIIHTGKSTIHCNLGEPTEFTYIIQAHALKHIDSLGKDCNAGLPEIHIHDIYNPYSKETKQVIPNIENINTYKTMLQRHIDFISPFITKALSQPYIQETMYHCATGNNSDGYTKKNVFTYDIPFAIYFEHDSAIYALIGKWKQMQKVNRKNDKFNDELYMFLSMEKPELQTNDYVFEIFQFVKTRLPDIPPFWFRCLQSNDYYNENSNENMLCIM